MAELGTIDGGDKARLAEASDLIARWDPPCNRMK